MNKLVFCYLITMGLFFSMCKPIKEIKKINIEQSEDKAISLFIQSNLFLDKSVYALHRKDMNEDVFCLTIIRSYSKILIDIKAERYKSGRIPKCKEVKNALFLWFEEGYIASEEDIKLLNKYDVLKEDTLENLIYLDTPIDDSLKALDVYFCKNNHDKYKKVKSRYAPGFYKMPKLNCK